MYIHTLNLSNGTKKMGNVYCSGRALFYIEKIIGRQTLNVTVERTLNYPHHLQ